MDQTLLDVLSRHGLSDFSCNKIVFGEADESLSTPAEKEFYEILKTVMSNSEEVVMFDKDSFPSEPVGFTEAMQMRTLFGALNVIKVLRTVGVKVRGCWLMMIGRHDGGGRRWPDKRRRMVEHEVEEGAAALVSKRAVISVVRRGGHGDEAGCSR